MNELDPTSAPASPVDLSSASFEPEAPEAPKPTLRRLFLGDDGLRAGWSVLLFLLLLAGTVVFENLLVRHFHLMPKPPAKGSAAAAAALAQGQSFRGFFFPEFFICITVLFVAFVMSLIERRPFARYGLGFKRMPKDFALGLFWGLFALSLLIGILLLTHTLAFDGVLLHGSAAFVYAIKWLLGFFLVGLFEEFFFRGYLQYTVSRGIAGIARALDPHNRHSFQWGFWGAAFLFSGLLFMAAHLGNSGESVSGIISVGLAGAMFAFSLYRTGSLWWAIGFHTTWDWAQSYLYGVHDSGTIVQGHLLASHPLGAPMLSGGADGPEGSIFLIPVFLLALLIIHFSLPKRAYPLTPDQSPLPTPKPLTASDSSAWSSPSTATPI